MELRHLRYFVAVAEAGSLTVAARQRLHTSQPSLSRQIRDLEAEVGTPLFKRNRQGIELTPAGEAFLDHARRVLAQVEEASEAARRVGHPAKPTFCTGFLTGHEVKWLPQTLRILRDVRPEVEVVISSQYSPVLARELSIGKLDAAFLRREPGWPDLEYRLVVREPLVAVMRDDHRLAGFETIDPQELGGETFVSVSATAPVLRIVIDEYLRDSGVARTPDHEVDHLAMAISLITSTRGVALLPAYAQSFLPSHLTMRPLRGEPPTIELVLGYRKESDSAALRLLLARLDEVVDQAAQ